MRQHATRTRQAGVLERSKSKGIAPLSPQIEPPHVPCRNPLPGPKPPPPKSPLLGNPNNFAAKALAAASAPHTRPSSGCPSCPRCYSIALRVVGRRATTSVISAGTRGEPSVQSTSFGTCTRSSAHTHGRYRHLSACIEREE